MQDRLNIDHSAVAEKPGALLAAQTIESQFEAAQKRAHEAFPVNLRVHINSVMGGPKCWSARPEIVVGGIWYQGLLADIGCGRAAGSRSRSAISVQALDEGGLNQRTAAGRTSLRADYLEQQTCDRAGVRTAHLVGTGGEYARRLRPYLAAVDAFAVVLNFYSWITSPASFSTQYQLERSPRSKPIVSLPCRFLLLAVATVVVFFIAGLLYLLRLERVDNLGAYSIPFGDRPSHSI